MFHLTGPPKQQKVPHTRHPRICCPRRGDYESIMQMEDITKMEVSWEKDEIGGGLPAMIAKNVEEDRKFAA